MLSLLTEANAIADHVIDLRREIHRHPEMGNAEFKTADLIERELDTLGLETKRPLETAVVGILRGDHPGPCIAFRADIDALPVQELVTSDFCSEYPGIMHACGHDMHTAALLGAARLLASHKADLHGTIKFFFQPDEEGSGGAQRMIDAGCLNDPAVEAVFGAHVKPELPAGHIGLRFGPAYAASNPFEITIHGRGAHGAEPQNGTDAIVIGSAIVGMLQTMVSRELAPTDSAVVTIGSFHAGTAGNIIADTAVLSGIMRCYGPEMRARLKTRLNELAEGVALSMGGRADVVIHESYSGVVNEQRMTEHVHSTASRLLGAENVVIESAPSLTTEDFGAFLAHVPGCFYHIGVGRKESGNAPVHSGLFDPDEAALATACALHTQIALDYLCKVE